MGGLRLLEHAGYRVIAASDGVEAEELISRHHAETGLAVLDELLPRPCPYEDLVARV